MKGKNCYLLTYTITFKNGIRSSSMPRDVIAEDFAQAEQLLKKHLIETDENVDSVTVTKSVMTALNVLVDDSEVEQLRVQLAGCAVAACGGLHQIAQPGDYGWSQAYQDVLELSRKHASLWNELNLLKHPEIAGSGDDGAETN